MAALAQPMYSNLYQRDPEGPPPYHPSAVKQWASRVARYSSQYNNTTWSADQVLGEPKVYPQHGDIHGSWAMGTIDDKQYLELEYDIPVCPTAINIYETFNPGAVVAVKILDTNGRWEMLWSVKKPVHLTQSRIFSPALKETNSKTTQIRIEVNCKAAGTWCEIDAVELVGIREGAVAPVDDTEFFDSLESLVNNKEYSDVKFEIDGKKLYAHKAILAARSKYFADMFHGKTQDVVVLKLPSTSSKDMLAIFHFIYTNKIPRDCQIKSLINLTEVSTVLGIPQLKTAAMYKILESMTCSNVIDTILLLKDTDKNDIKDVCLRFMAANLAEVSKTPGFERLPQSILVRVVQEATANMCLNPTSAR
ncbi:F-box/lrr-repeat protein 4 [Plakobranchus ocellatus]|uniref:F-box/lrr-repeat protein 4 n=1 Tax=Plakobranchus ocellatus TaxID=259542 RepID=A0AAV4DCP6_9GAST|nr:F-box/lrr-repeat protein 4 [Plakobranchus ocellatus]